MIDNGRFAGLNDDDDDDDDDDELDETCYSYLDLSMQLWLTICILQDSVRN